MYLIRFLLAITILAVSSALPARAITLLRDPDIEHALSEVAKPVLKAAGLGASSMNIFVIDDRTLNAFVIDRNSIFIHSGLLLKMETADMLQAVIAHEAAHITNGHLARRPFNLRNARTAAGLGTALAILTGVASGQGELAGLGAAVATNTAQRLFFAHTRSEENAADQSGIRYLTSAGIDPQGMVKVMSIFAGQEMLSASRQDPYARTHPLSRDRLRVIERLANAYQGELANSQQTEYWFQRARHKLSAFKRGPKWTLNRVGESGFEDIKAMRMAVAYHRQSDTDRAVAAIDRAIAIHPNDAFYYELKGQILMESRRFEAATNAYRAASRLDPENAMISGSYGRSLLTVNQTEEALRLLENARARDGRDPRIMRDLARAYTALGNRGMAALVTAERYAMLGNLKDAGIHAKRAADLLAHGSPAWQRAQDVLSASGRMGKRKR